MHFSADVKEKRERLLAAADWAGRCVSVACVHACVRVCVHAVEVGTHTFNEWLFTSVLVSHNRQRLYYG